MGMVEVLLAITASGPTTCSSEPHHPPLHVEVLEHRLDDQVSLTETAVIGRSRYERREPLVLGTGESLPLEALVEDAGRRLDPLADARQVGVAHPHFDFGVERRRSRDSRAHEPGPDHADARHRGKRPHRARRHTVVLLERSGGEEDAHQVARHVGDGELAEAKGLVGKPRLHAARQAHANRVECRERRRVVPSGLR